MSCELNDLSSNEHSSTQGFAHLLILIGFALAISVAACSPSAVAPRAAPGVDPPNAASPTIRDSENRAAETLLQERSISLTSLDHPLGAGDSLKITVPGTDEFTDCIVRVSGEGTVTIPLVGTVRAAGLSEDAITKEIADGLKKYIRNPQVQVYVQEYRGNQVGVFGAVAKPGVYNPASGSDSLQDMIAQAGGFTAAAARRIEFAPAKAAASGRGIVAASLHDADRVSIDLSDPMSARYLSMPARAGDILFVPELGQVLVQGWVAKPGSYPITPGLRVLGAIAAAGGSLYAADMSAVKLVRSRQNGGKEVESVDVDAIESGEARDDFVEDADVIDVGYSDAKIVPYGLYTALSEIFHLGAYVNPALP